MSAPLFSPAGPPRPRHARQTLSAALDERAAAENRRDRRRTRNIRDAVRMGLVTAMMDEASLTWSITDALGGTSRLALRDLRAHTRSTRLV